MRVLYLLPPFLLPFSAQALSVDIVVGSPPCGIPVGSLGAWVMGGVPPYTYSWEGPNGFTASSESINGLEAGTYTLTVTDFESTVASAEETLVDMPSYFLPLTGAQAYCDGLYFPFATLYDEQFYQIYGFTPPGPYMVNGTAAAYTGFGGVYAFPVPEIPGSSFSYTLVDGNGCSGIIDGVAGYQVEWPTMELLAVQPACSGGNNGGFTLGIGEEGHGQYLSSRLRDGDGDVVQVMPSVAGGNIGMGPTIVQYATLPPDDYTFELYLAYHSGLEYVNCSVPIAATVPADPGCGAVSGRVYEDVNENCVQSGEPGVPGVILEFTPGPYYATTNSAGDYMANLPLGTYTVAQQVADFEQHCPAPPTSVDITATPVVQNLADTALVPVDVTLAIASGAARPGFELRYAIDLDALTAASSGAMQLTMDFDPAVSYVSASPSPASVVGTTITWNIGQVGSFSHRDVNVTFQVPPDVGLVGTVLNASASVSTTNTDADLTNNSANTSVTVTASLDPNDKQVLTSSRTSSTTYFIGTDEWLDYTIRFQNTGTDTAFHVVVRDTLGADLDPSTVTWGAASHPYGHTLTGSGLLTFSFFSILLPDSNVNEPLSHGFVSFRIRPREPLLPGTALSNAADIYFDFNPLVHTNDAVLTAELSTAVRAEADDASCRMVVDRDELTLFAQGDRFTASLRMLSADGRVVRSVDRLVIDRQGTPMSIAGLAPGAYMLWILDAEGRATSLRFARP